MRTIILGAILALGVPTVASTAWAQPTQAEINKAKAAFNAGLALEAAGDWAQALGRFREVTAVKATPQALFHIGRCLEKLGKWTEAVGTYRLAVEKAEGSSEASVRQQADAARVSLESRLPKLVIERGRGAESASITLDGVALGSTAIGNSMPADPGPHVIVATQPGKPPATFNVVLAEGETKQLPIVMEAAPPPVASSAAPVQSAAPSKVSWTKKQGYYVTAGAGASALLGVVFLVLRNNALDDLSHQCYGTHCPESLEGTYTRAKVYTVLGDTFLVLGVVGLGVGTFMIAKGKKETAPPAAAADSRRLWLAPLGPSGPGASLGGTF
ncbi:MAG: tetratricopeptide repeat protein [Deltaproteobacteria bacterium]|nr:tetratricopeptide repeat protein [Deltaproteobacteria bacterium]